MKKSEAHSLGPDVPGDGERARVPGVPEARERANPPIDPDFAEYLIQSWIGTGPRCSPAVYREVEFAWVLGHKAGQPTPLIAGEYIPGIDNDLEPEPPALRRPRIPNDIIQAAKRVDILDVAAALDLGEPHRASATEHTILCPVHSEESPSCSLNQAKGLWHCFGCGVGGDVVALVRCVTGWNFPQTIDWLVALSGAEPRHPTPAG